MYIEFAYARAKNSTFEDFGVAEWHAENGGQAASSTLDKPRILAS
jgi:hypothetical protein